MTGLDENQLVRRSEAATAGERRWAARSAPAQKVGEAQPIQAGQPFDARCDAPLAHGLRTGYMNQMDALIAEARRMALSKGQRPESKGMPVVYILRLRSGALYIGVSEDLDQRLGDHLSGQACRTTHLDPPTAILRLEFYITFGESRAREAQLKRWSRAKKEALLNGDFATLHTLSESREAATPPKPRKR